MSVCGGWEEVSVGVRVGWEVRPCLGLKQPLDTAVSAVLGGRVGGEPLVKLKVLQMLLPLEAWNLFLIPLSRLRLAQQRDLCMHIPL
ncbi:hypothetical protein GOBAR_AA36996 [Gossypium barbadense]|uniref:Uncharacterized protein n=1 Tax=Gossypium barbadense TaxID=3634 RepID=A0A2P5VY21_GOSBA|nr:hypothetical protein GOBAR_AA36996 [Gossypium barbadense]